MELKRVVVTGLGAVTPIGNTPEETWKNALAGKSGAANITNFDTTLFKTHFACEVKDLNVTDFIDGREARKMDRYAQFAMVSAIQAVADSGMDLEQIDKDRIGVIFGVGIGGINTFESEVKLYGAHEASGPKFSPFFIPKMIADIAAGMISYVSASMVPTTPPPLPVPLRAMRWPMHSTSSAWARPTPSLPVVPRQPSVHVA